MTAARDAVVAAFLNGTDALKTVGELAAATRLTRAEVARVLAELAAADRLARTLSDLDGKLTVRWSLRR